MSEKYVIGISDQKTAHSPDMLITYALGSCIGISLFDPSTSIGGLAHIMLPDSEMMNKKNNTKTDRMKYADTAIIDLLKDMIHEGANRKRIIARIAGGANMFKSALPISAGTIGDRNTHAVKEQLMKLKIPLVGEDIGRDYGRTMFFDLTTGNISIQSLGKGVMEL